MAKIEIDIPDDELDEVKALLGKDGVPFPRRLYRAIRRAAAQKEFDSFVEVTEQARSEAVKGKDGALRIKWRVDPDGDD